MTGSVLIVGGGIAGRATARALTRHGLGCTVVERHESVGRGMGVNLPGNAVRALADLGVPDQVLASGVPVRRREYRNGRGRLLFAVDDERFWRDVGRPICVRHGDLLDALALPAAVTVKYARVEAAVPTPHGVDVDLEGAPLPQHVDFVIGADGVQEPVGAAVALALADGELHHAPVEEVRHKQWHNGRLVLIGDAAHATGPVWAQGVAMALEDALVLGELLALTPAEHWAGVGPAFERLRRPRVEHVQSATEKMSRLTALPGWLRDVSAPILGPRTYRAAYAPLRDVQ